MGWLEYKKLHYLYFADHYKSGPTAQDISRLLCKIRAHLEMFLIIMNIILFLFHLSKPQRKISWSGVFYCHGNYYQNPGCTSAHYNVLSFIKLQSLYHQLEKLSQKARYLNRLHQSIYRLSHASCLQPGVIKRSSGCLSLTHAQKLQRTFQYVLNF